MYKQDCTEKFQTIDSSGILLTSSYPMKDLKSLYCFTRQMYVVVNEVVAL